jgi:hypothetical protein
VIPGNTLSYFLLLLLLEFIIIHSSAFMGTRILAAGPRSRRALQVIGLGLFYTLFVGSFCLAFHVAWPLVAFWTLTANRLSGLLLVGAATEQESLAMQRGWAACALCYLVFVGATVILPVPRFGISPEYVASQHLEGGGLWIDQPHRALAAGFLYFTAVGISELFEHRWTASGVRAKAAA